MDTDTKNDTQTAYINLTGVPDDALNIDGEAVSGPPLLMARTLIQKGDPDAEETAQQILSIAFNIHKSFADAGLGRVEEKIAVIDDTALPFLSTEEKYFVERELEKRYDIQTRRHKSV